jgi:hypothetical protein
MPRVVHEGQRPARSVPHTSTFVLVALLFAAFVVGGAGTFAVLRYRAPRAHAAPPVSSTHVTAAVVETSVPVEALPTPAVPNTTTLVTFPRSAITHRVWIDGVLVGDDRQPMSLRCGTRTIKIGSKGKSRRVDLPCGRDVTLD